MSNTLLSKDLTSEVALDILSEAERLMTVPHAIVPSYMAFATDDDGQDVEYGDPAACRFCVAGVLNHAAAVVTGVDNIYYDAELRLVNGPEVEVDSYTYDESLLDGINVFDEEWKKANLKDTDTPNEDRLEQVREGVLARLGEMKKRWA